MMKVEGLSISGRLQDVSAAFQPGKITAICGPNGAGKSTLLTCLAGLLEPDSGSVTLGGDDVQRMHPRARAKAIGYLAQDGQIAWDMSVRNLVTLGRMPHGDGASQPVDSAIEILDLQALAHRPASTLSGGEKARTLLARVLAGEPQWVLADEPLAALDLAHQLSLLEHLRTAADEGAGVVLVLHDLALVMNHADHVLVLDQGKLAAAGAAQEALSSETIHSVWGVKMRWLGEPGTQALVSTESANNS